MALVRAWVGLDVGTTSSKAVVYDDRGRALAEGRSPTVWSTTADGVETDGDRLLREATAALGAAMDRLPEEVRVAGVGVTSMGETGVLVDGTGGIVAPSIAWHDTRDGAEVAALREDLGEEAFGAVAGNPLRGQFSLTKHRWLRPTAAVRRFNVAEWVVRGLSGAEVCDRSLAGRTGWYDIAADDWWDEALAWSHASRDLMPPVVDAGTVAGHVNAGPPRLHGAIVTTAGHDHQAAAVGVGAVGPGDELDSSGTAEALVRTVPPTLGPEQLLALARQGITTDASIQSGRWSLLGGTEGGLAMQRTLERLGVDRAGLPALDEAALGNAPDEAATEWRAATERATAEAAALHAAMSGIAGPHARLIAAGGWCHSRMVVAAKRRAFGAIEISGVTEAGALGAATMAARAAGALTGDAVLGEETP